MDYFDAIKEEYLGKFSIVFCVYKISSTKGTKEQLEYTSKLLEPCVEWIADKGEKGIHYVIQQEYYKRL